MTWTNPKTWTAEGITDVKLNEQIRDNMLALKDPPTDDYSPAYSASTLVSTSATAWADVDASTNLSITTGGGDILVCFASVITSAGNGTVYFDFTVNGSRQGGNEGLIARAIVNGRSMMNLNWLLTDLVAATYAINLQWKTNGTSCDVNLRLMPQFFVREVS